MLGLNEIKDMKVFLKIEVRYYKNINVMWKDIE